MLGCDINNITFSGRSVIKNLIFKKNKINIFILLQIMELSEIPSVGSTITDTLNTKGSGFDKLSSIGVGKGTILVKLFIAVLAILIIVISSSGYYVKKYCKEESIGINVNMIQFFMGFGTGLLFYLIFDVLKIIKVPIIIILGLFLSVLGGIYVNIYSKMSTECKKDTIGPELSFGMLGCGIGILTFVIMYNGLSFIPSKTLKWRIMAIIFTVFLIVIPSIIINMVNKCGDNYENNSDKSKISSIKTGQIVSLVLSIITIIAICVSFYFYPPVV